MTKKNKVVEKSPMWYRRCRWPDVPRTSMEARWHRLSACANLNRVERSSSALFGGLSTLCKFNRSRAKRVFVLSSFCTFLLLSTACTGKHKQVLIEDDQKDSGTLLVSAFKMYEPAARRQLTTGFYNLEANAWRWTAPNFAVTFKTPPEAAQRGATVTFDFVTPAVVVQKVGNFQLSASVKNQPLGTSSYSTEGPQTFHADVPAQLCTAPETVVNFHLDKSLPPTAQDTRQLGVIAVAASLKTK